MTKDKRGKATGIELQVLDAAAAICPTGKAQSQRSKMLTRTPDATSRSRRKSAPARGGEKGTKNADEEEMSEEGERE